MKRAEILNISGNSNSDVQKELTNNRSAQLALEVATFIGNTYFITTAISSTHDGVYLVDFYIDSNPHPTVRVEGQKVIWPKGSAQSLVDGFLKYIMGRK